MDKGRDHLYRILRVSYPEYLYYEPPDTQPCSLRSFRAPRGQDMLLSNIHQSVSRENTYTICVKPKYSDKRRFGNQGEELACAFLARKGFKILERNYLKPWGEIDIVAEKGGCVRFVEVKTVSREISRDFSREKEGYRPEEQVHPAKLRKIARTAETYMAERGVDQDYQVDVVTVYMDPVRRVARCRLYEQVM